MIKKNMRKENLFIRVAVLLTAGLLAGGSLTAQASEISSKEAAHQKESVTYVYHMHIGSSNQEGGCYRRPILHVHEGNEQEYGGCYETPIKHRHSGDEHSGGGCYGIPVQHKHDGNDSEGGECYRTEYHRRHESSCYKKVPSSELGCYVVSEEDTGDDDEEGNDYKNFKMSCGQTVYGIDSAHTHNVLDCGKELNAPEYILNCGKTEKSVDGYLLDCGKTEEDIDSYALSCNKTTEHIEAYGISCGKDKVTPVGKIIVTMEEDGNHEKETGKVRFEDLTHGEIRLSEEPFTWYDHSGNILGTGDTIEFYENGNYSVVLTVVNEDVNRDNLKVGVTVDSIVKPTPTSKPTAIPSPQSTPQPTPQSTSQPTPQPTQIPELQPTPQGSGGSDTDNADDDSTGNDNYDNNDNADNSEENSDEKQSAVIPTPTPTPTPTASPTATPETVLHTGNNNRDKGSKAEANDNNASDGTEKQQTVPTFAPIIRKQTQTVKSEEKNSGSADVSEIKTVEQPQSFFASPMGKLITITVGSFLLLVCLFLLLYLLRRSVRVYNDDGKGDMIYLGRCMVKSEEDGYSIEITNAMAEKAMTNRYCIKPGLFAMFRGEEEELIVIKGQKRISVALSKEMIVVV